MRTRFARGSRRLRKESTLIDKLTPAPDSWIIILGGMGIFFFAFFLGILVMALFSAGGMADTERAWERERRLHAASHEHETVVHPH